MIAKLFYYSVYTSTFLYVISLKTQKAFDGCNKTDDQTCLKHFTDHLKPQSVCLHTLGGILIISLVQLISFVFKVTYAPYLNCNQMEQEF